MNRRTFFGAIAAGLATFFVGSRKRPTVSDDELIANLNAACDKIAWDPPRYQGVPVEEVRGLDCYIRVNDDVYFFGEEHHLYQWRAGRGIERAPESVERMFFPDD